MTVELRLLRSVPNLSTIGSVTMDDGNRKVPFH